jgi:hypothetical protein
MPLNDVPLQLLALPEQVTRSSESRLTSADDARNAVNKLLQEDEQRSYQRAIVKSCYDGNSPYNERKRRQDGNAWMCNLNFMGLEGIMDSARIPYYSLFSGVPVYAQFKTSYLRDTPDASIWDQQIAEYFTCLLNRWRQFKWHMQASQFEMLFEGWGPLMFEDDADWRFRAIPARAVLVPQGSPSCLDHRVPFIAIKCDYRIHELYKHIRNEDAAEKRGWNVDAVQFAIKCGTRGQNGDTTNMRNQPWEEWQKRYKNKELMASYTEFDIINCVHLFVLEYTGKVSHFIVTYQSLSADSKAENNFLFKDVNRYDSYDQALNIAFQNTGDGSWHSVRGIGLKSFKSEEVRNRLNCRAVDNAFLASGMVLQGGDAQTTQKLQLRVNGAISYIPPGTTFVQHRMAGDIDGVLSVSRFLQNELAQKIGAFNQRSIGRTDGRGEVPTATQVEFAAAKEGSLSASQIDNYYLDLDALYSEVFRRVLISSDPEAKRFREDCLNAGIPMDALRNMEYVRANRQSGYGSPQMRKMAMQELMQLYPLLNQNGKNAALNELISASQGTDKITVFNPAMNAPDSDEWMATMENDKLHEGEIPVIISGMDHAVHLNIHLDDAEQRLMPLSQAVESGEPVDPESLNEAFQYVTALATHCEEHLAILDSNPAQKQLADVFEGQLKIITAFHGKLRSALRKAQSLQAQQAREQDQAVAMSALDQAKLQREQQGMALDNAKVQNDIQRKNIKTTADLSIKRWKAGQDNQLKTVKVAEDIRLDRIDTLASVQEKRLNTKNTNGSKKQ